MRHFVSSSRRVSIGAPLAFLILSGCASNPSPDATAPVPGPTAAAAADTAQPATPPAAAAAAAPTTAAAAAAPPAAPATAAPAPRADALQHAGIAAVFLGRVDKLTLKPEQTATIAAIRSDLEKLGQDQDAAQTKFASDLADGVAAGKIDKVKVQADIADLQKAVSAAKPVIVGALDRLHKSLEPDQRKALVDTGLTPAEEGGPNTDAADDFNLTPEQKSNIEAKLTKQAKVDDEARKHHAAILGQRAKSVGDAFATDKFDAKKVHVEEDAGDAVKQSANGYVASIDAVLPVLNPDQRNKLAVRVREHRVGPGGPKASPGLCCLFRVACCIPYGS